MAHDLTPEEPTRTSRLIDFESTALLVLWVLWAALLFGGFLFSEYAADGGTRIGPVERLGSSVVLVAAAWVWCFVSRSSPASRPALYIAIGMTLGCLGDFFNAGVLQGLIPLPNPVLGGIAAFGLGHVAYIAACLQISRRGRLDSQSARSIWLAVWLTIGIAGWFYVVWLGRIESARMLVWPALPYSLLLAATAGFASGLAAQNRRLIILAAGAALFLLSDLILAWRMFRGDFAAAGDMVWLTYGPGQMLIVYSNAVLPRVLRG